MDHAIACLIKEMQATNKRLDLLTRNLGQFTSSPLSGTLLGPQVDIGKRPFYPDSTIRLARHNSDAATPTLLWTPPLGTWVAIVGYYLNQNKGHTKKIWRDKRNQPTTAPVDPSGGAVDIDHRVMIDGSWKVDDTVCCNFFPGAFIINPDEELFINASSNTGIIKIVLYYTSGKLR